MVSLFDVVLEVIQSYLYDSLKTSVATPTKAASGYCE
jgi:hypothetical protein